MFHVENNYQFIKGKPVVLIAPLDWGLGHTTRCIPLITFFLAIGCEVIIASDGHQQVLLQQEFSTLRFEKLEGYGLRYGNNSYNTIMKLLLQIPKILTAINFEHQWLNAFLQNNRVDAVISDNRYGMYSSQALSIFITHQLTIKTPFGKLAEWLLRKWHYRLIEKFNECWVPDEEGNGNLAGELSHPPFLPGMPVKYLGRLSRLRPEHTPAVPKQLLILLSGPEPQRSIFEHLLLLQLAAYQHPAVMVRGLPMESAALVPGNKNLVVHNHLPASSLNQAINVADVIISRSGYSTVMDLIGLQKKCIFVPTPGQAEQQYLARYLQSRHLCMYYRQHAFSIEKALRAAERYHPAVLPPGKHEGYKDVIRQLADTWGTAKPAST